MAGRAVVLLWAIIDSWEIFESLCFIKVLSCCLATAVIGDAMIRLWMRLMEVVVLTGVCIYRTLKALVQSITFG